MEFHGFDPNTKLAAVYYNGGTPPHLFRIRNDVSLSGLKDELDQINRKNLEYFSIRFFCMDHIAPRVYVVHNIKRPL